MKFVFRALLIAAIIVMAYLCTMSILTPIHFKKERVARQQVIVSRLINIRTSEIEFKNAFGHYTADPDSLVDFVLNGKMAVVLKEGELTDDQLKDGLTEKKAVAIVEKGNLKEIKKNGLENFRRDTSYVSVFEKTFGQTGLSREEITKMVRIPNSNGKLFEFETTMHLNEATGINIPLFEARAPYDAFLGDLNHQELVNLKDTEQKLGHYIGLKVGSIEEPNNNAGNWE